jgi:hypothetical protein
MTIEPKEILRSKIEKLQRELDNAYDAGIVQEIKVEKLQRELTGSYDESEEMFQAAHDAYLK